MKKVDLGAAANFGINSPTTLSKEDALDDFNPRALDNIDSKTSTEFGDFENAFVPKQPLKTDDDFADFSSAFEQAPNQNLFPTVGSMAVNQSHNTASQNNLLLDPLSQNQSNLNMHVNSNLIQSPPAQMNLFSTQETTTLVQNSDLLGDLSNFSSLNIQANNVNLGMPLNGNSIKQQPQSLLDGFTGGMFSSFT